MTGPAYVSSEDSALLRMALGERSGERFLEIGAGNGGTLVRLAGSFELAVGTDIVRPTMTDWKGAGADFVLADGAGCFRDASFDLVAFNPPYIPLRREGDPAVEGGADLEVPKAFLRDSLRVVTECGEVVFLLNDRADVGEFQRICSDEGFGFVRIASERLFFEELAVYSSRPEGGYCESTAKRLHQVPASPS